MTATTRERRLVSQFPEIEEAYRAYICANHGESHASQFVADMSTICLADYSPKDYDPAILVSKSHNNLKIKVLEELDKLSNLFPKIPKILWHCIAHVTLREDPTIKSSLLKDPNDTFLYGDAVLNDTALHSAGIVLKLMHYINASLMKSVGYIVVHGHSCDCCIEAEDGNVFLNDLSLEEIEDLSKCFFAHFCAEWVKTRVLGLPLPLK